LLRRLVGQDFVNKRLAELGFGRMSDEDFAERLRTEATFCRRFLESIGGRFTDGPTTYGANTWFTAWLEVNGYYSSPYGNPRSYRGFHMTVPASARLADARDPALFAFYEMTSTVLLAKTRGPECRTFAQRLRSDGYEGLIYPSVRDPENGLCFALFLDRLQDGIVLEPVTGPAWDGVVTSLLSSEPAR